MSTGVVLRAIDADPTMPVKPWQRLSCLLYSNGTPLNDVAKEVGMDLGQVSEFVTSTRGVQIMKALVMENPERMVNLVEATVVDSLLRLVRLRDLGKTEAVQISAAAQLLDRFYPKAKGQDTPKKNTQGNEFTNVQDEIARLKAEVSSRE